MASLWRHPKTGIWQADIWVGGRKFPRTTKTKVRREAQAAIPGIEARVRKEIAEDSDAAVSLVLDQLAVRYRDTVAKYHSGADNTERLVSLVLWRLDASRKITEITHNDVMALREWRRTNRVGEVRRDDNGNWRMVKVKKGAPLISPYTVNDTVEQVRKLFTFARNNGVTFNPRTMPKWNLLWLKEPEQKTRELTDQEAPDLAQAILTVRPDYAPFFQFAWATGRRLYKECMLLEWKHVSFKRGVIELPGKGGGLVRVDINEHVHAILWPLYQARKDKAGDPQATERVFTFVAARTVTNKVIKGKTYNYIHGKRYPMTKWGIRPIWKAIRKAAGIPTSGEDRFRGHDIRHDFGTKAARAFTTGPEALKGVGVLLGHSPKDTRSTMRYMHTRPEIVQAAAVTVAAAQAGAFSGKVASIKPGSRNMRRVI